MIEERPGKASRALTALIALAIAGVAVGAAAVVRRMYVTEQRATQATRSTIPPAGSPAGGERAGSVFALAKARLQPDPTHLATALAAAERAIRSAQTPVTELAEPAKIAQAAYRQLADQQQWLPDVLAAMPADVRPHAEAQAQAAIELRALTTAKTNLPPWRIAAPPPAARLRAIYESAGREGGVGWQYLAAIHLVETRMGRIHQPGTARAQGPMQLLASVWAVYGEGDINDPRDAIRAAARFLQASGAPDHIQKALYAYNPSDHYVAAVTAYATELAQEPRLYDAYWQWQVYYRTVAGDALLPEGWHR